jgi:purine-binding chemotaxis protein CheW
MTASSMKTANASGALEAADTQQFLTFELGGEEYGVGILTVQEIRGWSSVTKVPHTPGWLLGVINLRGVVVPIIDLRLKFKFAKADYTDTTVVIILTVATRVVGVVVDGVSDVITLGAAQIKPAPSLGTGADTRHIIGFGTLDERMRILMDVEKLMAGPDMGLVDKAIH